MRNGIYRLFLASVIWAFCWVAVAQPSTGEKQPILTLGDFPGSVPIDGALQLLVDPTAQLSVEDVANAPMKTLPSANLATGFTRSAIWLRLMLHQPESPAPTDWRLEIDNVQVNDVQFYLQTPNGAWEEQRAGRQYAHKSWPLRTRVPVFMLSLQPGETYPVLVRIASDHTLTGAVRLWSTRNFADHAIAEALGLGAYFGAFVCALLLQVFFWGVGKERRFGWYVLYTVVIFLAIFLNSGYIQNTFDLGDRWSIALMGAFLCLAPAVTVRMAVMWMELGATLPRLARHFETIVYTVCGVTAILVLAGSYTLGLQVNQAGALLWTIVSMGIGLYIWRVRKDVRGLHYIAVFCFVDAGLLIRLARNIGLLPSSPLTDYALFIGVALHLVAMSVYFMYTYTSLREALHIEQTAREEQRDFVNMVSHEFRTPLAIISTSAQQLASNPTASMERIQQRAQNIRNATIRLNRLLDEYLSVDRLDSTQHAVALESGDFYEVIEDSISDWDIGKVHVHIENLPTPFVCDHGLMRIVLRNLLANAIRHSPADSAIDLRVIGTSAGGMQIEVEDRGCGLGSEELSQIFQKYFRGRAAQREPGAGLGLYLVKRIVEQHGGGIRVASAPGQGTVFVINLPGSGSVVSN